MPLPKPDQEHLRRILQAREAAAVDDGYELVIEAALLAIGDGAITPQRANNLIWALETNPTAAAVFPNNVLLSALHKATAGWSDTVEHDLLVFIFTMYSGAEDIDHALWQLDKFPLALFGDLYPAIFDAPPGPICLTGMACDFTGSFPFGPRRRLFEMVGDSGGAATDNIGVADFLFVAESHVEKRVISGAMRDALRHRQRHGTPKIYRERHFPAQEAPAE